MQNHNLKPMSRALEVAESVIARSLKRAPLGTSPVLAWPLVCGHSVATRTNPTKFENGILQIQVPDAGWRAELRNLASQYLAVINRYSAEPVQRIEFVIASQGPRA